MISHETDRRVIRTRQIIYEALSSLMQERQYDKITVQDIIDRANIGRSTFYSHFETKDELLKSSIENMMESLNEHLTHVSEGAEAHSLISVAELFRHVKENNRLMKALVKGKSIELYVDKVQSYLNEKIENHLRTYLMENGNPSVPLPIVISFVSSTIIFLLRWWIDNKMQYSPEEMERYFYNLVIPSIQSVSAKKT